MKNFLRYIIALSALFTIGCHGTPNDLVVENKPELEKPTIENKLKLSVDKTTLEADGVDFVTFSLTLDGKELTTDEDELAKIYFIHEKSGNRLERYATTFSAVKNGDYSFVATYKGQQSANSVQVKAVNREQYEPYNQKIMIYDLTSAWCPNCPTMTAGLANIDPMWKSNAIVLAVHNNDPWELSYEGSDLATAMLSRFGGQGYPSCVYDLQYLNGNARTPKEIGDIIEKHIATYPATCGVKIESTKLVGTTLTIEAAMTSATGGEYDFGYAVLLDNQKYTGGTAIDDMYSDIVVAKSDNFLEMGDSKITTMPHIERTKSFTVENLKYTDAANMRVVVYVLTKVDGKVMVDNANVCPLGGSVDYAGAEHYNGLPETKLTLTTDKNTIVANGTDAVTFTIKYGNEDVSNDKSVNLIRTFNGEQIELAAGANSFTTTVAGSYTFKARYYKGAEIISDDKVTIVATSAESAGAQNFRHKLLGMQFTSIGCPNCPTLGSVIKSIQATQPNRLVPVSFHIDYTISDPMKIAMGDTYYKTLKGNGLPMFYLDLREGEEMTSVRSVIEQEMAKRVANYPPTCGVAISTAYDSATRQLTIEPRIQSNIASSYRYLIMLVEDNIVYQQYGITGDYTHNNVVRAVLSGNIYGDKFNNNQTLEAGVDTPLATPVTTTLPSNWKPENMRVVVSALSTSDNGMTYHCNNTNECAVGQSVGYALESGNNEDNPGGDEVADVEFNRHVSVFEFTGAWCAMCPSGYVFLKYLIEDWYSHDTVHILALHDSTGGADPMGISLTNELVTKFGIGGFPGFLVDMREATSEKTEIQGMIDRSFSDYPATCGIKMVSTDSSVDIELYAAKSANYRVALYILEDGIVARQNNGGTYKDDYIHNHVVRAMVSKLYEGDRVGEIKAAEKATKSYTFSLDSSWKKENCTLCALVFDNSQTVINAAVCAVGESVDYDYKK
ncbi:MAG: Omp28-related outer membrane protein [Alistipes sp.]|nr:Omp28-related outer membrane protein [Alistipes sp.]